MRIERLWDRFRGKVCIVVGTGPSLRLMDKDYLYQIPGRTIGLNNAYQHLDCDYGLTIHPELIPYPLESAGPVWITKRKGEKGSWSSRLAVGDKGVFVFESNSDPHDFTYCGQRVENKLYCGRGIQATAITLAAHMGFQTCILVGCDMAELGGDHHAEDQHVRFHGLQPEEIYDEYYECTAKVRAIVRQTFGMQVLTLSPFLGAKNADRDYRRLRGELNLGQLPKPVDTSQYTREKDF